MANGDEGFGSTFEHWLAAVIFLVGQLIAGVVWLTKLGARVKSIEDERKIEREERIAERTRLDAEMKRIDTEGTRALAIVDDRQKDVLRRLDLLESKD